MIAWLRRLFCTHAWEVLSKETLPSPYEVMLKAQQTQGATLTKVSASTASFEQYTIVILTCPKCGALDKTEMSNWMGMS
jgi:hypothetical protein